MTDNHKKRIAIYADRHSKASPSPIDQELRRSFPENDIDIELVDQQDIRRDSFYRDLLLLVIPGIEGETSLYHQHIGPVNQLIRDYLSQGGAAFLQCGGANYAGLITKYTPEWGPAKMRDKELLGIFNGIAHGPLPGLGVDGEDPQYYRGLTSANVLIGGGKHAVTIPLVYTSGPTFIPNPGQDMMVHGRYADVPGLPPAIISFQYGRGFVLLSGPVPQNGARPPTNIGRFATLDALLERLRPHEDARMWFFDHLMNHVRFHARKTGLLPPRAV